MIKSKKYPSMKFQWTLFYISIPVAFLGIFGLAKDHHDWELLKDWSSVASDIALMFAPLYFVSEISKRREGFTKVIATTNKLFKCRVSGEDEVFYLKADTEEEAELFFATILEGKNVFIEESNIKLLGFNLETPNQTNEA